MDKQPPGSGREEGIIVAADLVAYAVHGVGDLVVCMARNVLVERGCIHFTAGAPLSLSESLRALEDVVRNGYGNFHTWSITGAGHARWVARALSSCRVDWDAAASHPSADNRPQGFHADSHDVGVMVLLVAGPGKRGVATAGARPPVRSRPQRPAHQATRFDPEVSPRPSSRRIRGPRRHTPCAPLEANAAPRVPLRLHLAGAASAMPSHRTSPAVDTPPSPTPTNEVLEVDCGRGHDVRG